MDRTFICYDRNDKPSKPVSFTTAISRASLRIITGAGPFKISQDGDSVSSSLTRSRALKRLRRRLKNGEVGPVYRVRRGNGDVVFKCREVAPPLHVVNTNGNGKADLYWSKILATFPNFHPSFAGAYVCKTVAGTSTMSQHSYGNAVDIFFDSMSHQETVAAWVVAHADELHAEHVISGSRIWSRGVGWHGYTGEYHAHLHVDFAPSFSGSCGVRN